MTSNLLIDIPHSAAELSNKLKTWLVVSQVKSHRVVYFTDDADYTPPTEGDWYYVSPYQGELPKAMSLRNCWGWRFNGMEFVDAREKKKPDPAQTLLANNKEALHKLLRDKIDAMRKPLAPNSAMGGALRALRLQEARAILSGDGNSDVPAGKLLLNSAAARGITLQAMAQRTLAAHESETHLLVESELLRDEIAVAIDTATDQQQLMVIRQRLMNQLAPQLGEQFKVKPEHTTPRQLMAKPTPNQLSQEQLRLRVQLRLKINALRRGYVSDYLLDDIVLKHKGHLAQAVLAQGGQVPEHIDATPLMSHAAARGQTLVQAAKEVLTEMDETACVLLETEQMKDALLARIASLDSFEAIDVANRVIQNLHLPAASLAAPPAAPSTAAVTSPPQKVARSHRPSTDFAQRREAVLAASRRLGRPQQLPRLGPLDAAAFVQQARKGQPFIMRGAASDWPLARLTPEALVQQWGHLPVRARVGDYVEKAFTDQRRLISQSLAAYLSQIQTAAPGQPGDWPAYLGNQTLPELTALCQWPAYFSKAAEPRIWLGPADTLTPLHCDYDDNLFAQIWGRKRLVLFAPHEAEHLYTHAANPVLLASRFNPDAPDYEAMPKARKAQAIECIVEPGDLLYLPAGWFHQVQALALSLSANLWAYDTPLALTSQA